MRGVRAVTAALAESCDAACLRETGRRCDVAALGTLNSCEQLRAHFACRGCSPSSGRDQPAHVDASAPASALPGQCVYNSPSSDSAFDCAASHPLTRRLCACAP